MAGALEISAGRSRRTTTRLPQDRSWCDWYQSGDVIGDGPEIHGEAVNIAARLEPLAEPGGICVLAGVHEEARDKLECVFDDMGLLLPRISRGESVFIACALANLRRRSHR